ncbi:hypothetical protein NDU88_005470 [Pleurodeles waltl]|uniref:Transducer of regulated CREB activity N-terminal domain-containing protein n=1 Tax=Pleurodeles waltl TaxID=8319 RepID=A0AAV7TX80_PLEWA|nr:hypothetical protein NDU88_005470 [Pleurodeles waltl]
MATSPGSSSSNPRKFSEKIALHNQKQAEETRAFDELMTDLTMSRVRIGDSSPFRLLRACKWVGSYSVKLHSSEITLYLEDLIFILSLLRP